MNQNGPHGEDAAPWGANSRPRLTTNKAWSCSRAGKNL